MEILLTDLFDQKLGEAVKTTCVKVEKTYAGVIAVEKSTDTVKPNASQRKKHNISRSLRVQGVSGDPSKGKEKNLSRQLSKWTISWTQGELKSVVALRRLEKSDAERTKPRTLLVKLRNDYEGVVWRCLALSKIHKHGNVKTKERAYITCSV